MPAVILPRQLAAPAGAAIDVPAGPAPVNMSCDIIKSG